MKTIYKVKQTDLIGAIEDFPIEIVQKMVEEQVKQGNEPDVTLFQNDATCDFFNGGFTWEETNDGEEFWDDVIVYGNYDLFFERYPKKPNLVYIVGDSEVGIDIIKTLEKYGGINEHNFRGDSDGCVYYIEPNNNFIEVCDFEKEIKLWEVLMATYQPIDAEEFIVEITMEDVAKKFGVDVNKLRIKK